MDAQTLARDFQLAAAPADFHDDPAPYFAALIAHDPVHRQADGSLLLTRYADVVEVYRNPDASSDKKVEFAPKYGNTPLYEHHTGSMVFNDPPRHTRLRRLIMGAVNQRAIARMEGSVITLIDRLLDELADKGSADLVSDFAAVIPIDVIGNLLSVPQADRSPLREWSLAILGALEPVLTPEMAERGNRAVTEFSAFLRALIADRRAHPLNPEEDVLSRFLAGEEDGDRLTESELIHNCIFLLNAGHETTANLIGNGLWNLMRFPAQQARLRADPALLPSAIEEMLRYDSPIQINNRRLLRASEIGGQPFEAGTRINLWIAAANRDPAQFADPDRFDIARRPNRHIAFGQGDHACVGMNVARMEGRLAIGRLLSRFTALEIDGEPERDRRMRFRGFRRLPVRVG